jgi:spermidine synthase
METLDRRTTPRGELALRRRPDGIFELISNGVFLMSSEDGTSERRLVDAAAEVVRRPLRDVVVAGLGVGFTLTRALTLPTVDTVTVVEIEPAVVEWNRTHLAAVNARALDDPRVRVAVADLAVWADETGAGTCDALLLDVDNGPGWTVTDDNADLYSTTTLARLAALIRPGGVLAVWSAQSEPRLAADLERLVGPVTETTVPVARGEPDRIYAATRRDADDTR